MEVLNRDVTKVTSEIKAKSPKYTALTQPQALEPKDIQTQVLDADTLLLEYSLGVDQSYLWAVTPTSIHGYELPKEAVIREAAHKVHDLLATMPQSRSATKRSSTRVNKGKDVQRQHLRDAIGKLSDLLLSPVSGQIKGKRLLIVADGALQYLPFGALILPGQMTQKPAVLLL